MPATAPPAGAGQPADSVAMPAPVTAIAAFSASSAPRLVVTSPDGSVQWRVRADNRVERMILAPTALVSEQAIPSDAAREPVPAEGAAAGGAGRGGAAGARGGGAIRTIVQRAAPLTAVQTWQPLSAPPGIVLTAASSPLPGVCWFVGKAGAVLIGDASASLRRAAAPDPSDLTAVTATSARSAIVTTSDGLRFATDDAGVTWRREP